MALLRAYEETSGQSQSSYWVACPSVTKATVTVFGWCLHGSLINSFKIVWHLFFLHQLSKWSIALGFLLCFECFETVALWQHCIDYNTDSARLSVLWKTDCSSNKEKEHCSNSVTAAHHYPPSSSPQTTKHLPSRGT